MIICFCFYFNIARDVVTILFLFVDIYHFNYTFSQAHIEAHTHAHTRIISTKEEWRQPRPRMENWPRTGRFPIFSIGW